MASYVNMNFQPKERNREGKKGGSNFGAIDINTETYVDQCRNMYTDFKCAHTSQIYAKNPEHKLMLTQRHTYLHQNGNMSACSETVHHTFRDTHL